MLTGGCVGKWNYRQVFFLSSFLYLFANGLVPFAWLTFGGGGGDDHGISSGPSLSGAARRGAEGSS